VDKQTMEITERTVGKKMRRVVNKAKGAAWEEVPLDKQFIPCLNDDEIKEVAKLAKALEERVGCFQDIEWAMDSDFRFPQNIFLLQTRPAKVAIRTPVSVTDRIIDLMAKLYRH